MKLRLLPIIIALILVPVDTVNAAPSPTTLSFEIFTDGVVRTDYGLTVDQTAAQVNVTLYGDSILDLFIYDDEGLPLESTEKGGFYEVNSLGASSLEITYLTPSLTGKTGAIWSIEVESPISAEIVLPLSSTIINLNEIPLEIETVDDQTHLIMPAGIISVSYTVGIKDSKTLSVESIAEAQSVFDAVNELGFNITAAENILAEAVSAFESEDYITAQEKAYEAGELAAELGTIAATINLDIIDLKETVHQYELDGRTVGLDDAKNLLDEAEEKFDNGEYMPVIALLQEVEIIVHQTSVPESNDNTLLIAGAAILLLIVTVLVFQRRSSPEPHVDEEEIDLERLFLDHPEFRLDDKEALRFMAEHGGEAFAHEIRERLDIPRTSAWRMIQRLQRYEVVEERKIGGQSLISIVDQYRRKKK